MPPLYHVTTVSPGRLRACTRVLHEHNVSLARRLPSLINSILELATMDKKLSILGIALGLTLSASVIAAESAGSAREPCEQIAAACTAAGFVKGEAKNGYGLWHDCIDPIMRGASQPPNADKPLPSVSPELVEACKQRHPEFGEGKRPPPNNPRT